MSHFYSRTGFPKNIPISSTKKVISETTEDNTFTQEYYEYPECWQVDKVKFNRLFFNQYDWDTNRYDWRYVFIQIETHEGRKFYFDGMDWKETSGNIAITNGLKIGYRMNDKATYYTKFKPEVISHDGYYYYFEPQSSSQESWIQRCNNIREIDDGRFSIKLPVGINDTNSTLTIKVSNSDFLGRCGEVYYTYYNGIFKPANMTYIKGEHLNFKCDVVVPESNLGQMFAKSDIRYSSNTGKKYSQEAKEVTFNVNTYHPLVNTSTSYLMFDDRYLEKNILYQYWQTRLEEYCLAAYQNHYGQIRKVYQNTLKFNDTHEVN